MELIWTALKWFRGVLSTPDHLGGATKYKNNEEDSSRTQQFIQTIPFSDYSNLLTQAATPIIQ